MTPMGVIHDYSRRLEGQVLKSGSLGSDHGKLQDCSKP